MKCMLGIHIERVSCVCGVCGGGGLLCGCKKNIKQKNEKCLLVIPAACKCTPVCEEEDEDANSDM